MLSLIIPAKELDECLFETIYNYTLTFNHNYEIIIADTGSESEVLEKTREIKKLIQKKNLNTEIEIDGGINFENCAKAKKAGANVIVSGSTIFKENQGDLKKNIEILRTS